MKLPIVNNQNEVQIIQHVAGITITKETPQNIAEGYGKECTQCGKCCSLDSGMVLEKDIPALAKFLEISETELKQKYLDENSKFNTFAYKLKRIKPENKPYGKCILFDEKTGCTVHEVKPTHCRVCSTKSKHGEQLSIWFILNYFVNPNDPESIRQYAQYLKTHPTIPGGELEKLVPDPEKLKKILRYELFR